MADRTSNATDDKRASGPAVGHMVPLRVLLSVCIALLVLTWITVTVSYIHLGQWNLWVAMGIASVKALLVVLFFMHLRYDRPFNAIILLGAILFLLIFVGMTLLDSVHYRDYVYPVQSKEYAPTMESKHQRE